MDNRPWSENNSLLSESRLHSFDAQFYNSRRSLGKEGSFRNVNAVFSRAGTVQVIKKGGKPGFRKTACFRDVESTDRRFGADHLWVDWLPEFDGLRSGDKVQFSGVVKTYSCKGRQNVTLDKIQNFKKV